MPGEQGNAVINGHVDTPTGRRGVFYKLSSLKEGDKIIIQNYNGDELYFKVIGVVNYPYDQLPLAAIFGESNTPHLNLITCAGNFEKSQKTYTKRTVIYSVLQS